MKKDTNIKQTYIRCWGSLRKSGAIVWSAVAGRRAFSILTASLAGVAGCLVLIAAIADWQIRRLDVNLIPEMEESSHVYDRNGKELCQFWKQKRTVVPLSNISTHLVNAILAMEDQGFYQHHGYDFSGILRAGWANLCAGKIEQGGSTLTQQLAKNTFLNPSRSYWRKLQELWLARKIEKRYSKPEILEFYVNRIYWGSGFYGAEEASQGYFGKPASELSLSEAALLAGITAAPSVYSPHAKFELCLKRRDVALEAMVRHGFATAAEVEAARHEAVEVLPKAVDTDRLAYAADAIRSEVLDTLGYQQTFAGGLRVYTTIDAKMQLAAEGAIGSHLTRIEKEFKLLKQGRLAAATASNSTNNLQGALVSMNVQTGEIGALVGGRSFIESKFNRALYGKRQPGSAFKAIVYAAALNAGMTPATVIQDAPLEFDTMQGVYRPTNSDQTFSGAVTLRTALRKSINSVAIQAGQAVGVAQIVALARAMGLEGPLPAVISLPLGSGEATLFEMVRAYSVFPNQGKLVQPLLLRRIEDKQGRVLYQAKPEAHQVLSPEVAFLMTSMLVDAVNRGTGSGVRAAGFHVPVGGKTGTTNDYRDAWFIGFTPDIVTGVWIGYDQPREIARRAYGARLAVPLWAAFMKQLPRSDKGFSRPSGIVQQLICPETGLLASPECDVETEYFTQWNTPHEVCAGHHSEAWEDVSSTRAGQHPERENRTIQAFN
ncbi:MAG: PBP1A family penicillin-binding protein [Acidobacteria bacterium]|nr:PBP1A family penicillin-binding protein [Acidobacteriota bacterium]MCI0622589.1 PBP1A family penicillin-binding protein [Acidobacteriota bacterium]MCI0719726.1 PBP1A family penicillin-binding protein [Acidobacteriota bacterium]